MNNTFLCILNGLKEVVILFVTLNIYNMLGQKVYTLLPLYQTINREKFNIEYANLTFKEQILEGIPDVLPQPKPYNHSINQ